MWGNIIFLIAWWCNGSTADFGSVCRGSNPCRAAIYAGKKMRKRKKEPSALWNLLLNIVLPTLILIKGTQYLYCSPKICLIIALFFPVTYGLYTLCVYKEKNILSIVGLFSILVTGTIALIELPKELIVFKEGLVPLCIGIFVYFSFNTSYSLLPLFIYNKKLFQIERIEQHLDIPEKKLGLQALLKTSNSFLALAFLLSSILNFILAIIVLQSEPGTPEFTKELGHLNALSYVAIALPCTLICVITLFRFLKRLQKLTGLKQEEILKN